MEQAIAEKGSRVARYEKRLRDAGFVKVCVWATVECAEEIRALAAKSRASAGEPG